METRDPALAQAIRAIGGYTALRDALGLSSVGSIHNWRKCPLHWVKRVSELSGVPKHELAPDHYDPPVEVPDNVS